MDLPAEGAIRVSPEGLSEVPAFHVLLHQQQAVVRDAAAHELHDVAVVVEHLQQPDLLHNHCLISHHVPLILSASALSLSAADNGLLDMWREMEEAANERGKTMQEHT